MELIALTSDKNLEGIWNKETHNYTNPLLVQHRTHLHTSANKKHTQSHRQQAGKTHK